MQLLCPCSCYCVFCADTCYGGSQVRAQSALAGLLCGSVCSLLGACLDVFAGIAGSAWLKVHCDRLTEAVCSLFGACLDVFEGIAVEDQLLHQQQQPRYGLLQHSLVDEGW